jgi:serine protease SohB
VAEFFFNFGLFAVKAILLFALIGITVGVVAGLVSRQTRHSHEQLTVTKLNARLDDERETMEGALMDDVTWHSSNKERRAKEKAERKAKKRALKASRKARADGALNAPGEGTRRRVYVVDFDGDLQATAVASLRRELTAITSVTRPEDEVVVRLESGGGLVHAYGLAASQLDRVRSKGVKLTVCVDKVAASGGYMMACVANQILAAPFAAIGSIGVVAQLPNFHRLLKKHDVDFELMTAGEHKRTLTVFGPNTEADRKKFRQDLEETHALFKEFVLQHRPTLDIAKVATGKVWWGARALSEGLVDRLETSDEYLIASCADADVLEVKFEEKKSLQDKLMSSLEAAVDRTILRLWSRATERPLS